MKKKLASINHIGYYLLIFVCLVLAILVTFTKEEDIKEVEELSKLQSDLKEVKIGVLAKRGYEQCLNEWSDTAIYLTDLIEGYEFSIVPLSFEEINSSVSNESVDFILTNSAMYIELEVKYGVSRLVTLVNKRLDYSLLNFGGVIFTTRNSVDIEKLEDIKGKSFAAVSSDSFGGWQMAQYEFFENGIDTDSYFEKLDFKGTHDAVVYSVLNGEYDVGTVRTDTIERMNKEGLIDINKIKIINEKSNVDFPFYLSTDLYPEWPLAKTPHIADELAHKVALGLMEIHEDDQAAISAKIRGFTIPQNYQKVNKLLMELRATPYENYGEITFKAVLIKYRLFIIIMLILFMLIIWFAYNLRISREKVQAALEKSKVLEKEAIEASKTKSRFLANMSHEIRTPMNAIIGFGELMQRTQLTAKQSDYQRKMLRSAKSLLQIINNVLDFSKIEANKMSIEKISFSINEILNNISSLLTMKMEEKQLEFIFDVSATIPQYLIGDPVKITQILTNLINNAMKFTNEGQIILKADYNILSDENINLSFEVIDTGIGMTKEQVKRLFNPFTQADVSTTRKYGGTGLGLTIAKELVELMGGEISVESKKDEGTKFSFNLHLQLDKEKDDQFNVPADFKKLKALIIDDNEISRKTIRRMLESFKIEAYEASSGEGGIDILENEEIDLVVVDYLMPKMNGIETIIKLRQMGNRKNFQNIMMISAYGREEIRNEAKVNQINYFIDKPVNASYLFDCLMEMFEGSKSISNKMESETELKESKITLNKLNLLLVEDNSINQQIAKEILQQEGFSVVVASNGEEALEKVINSSKDEIDLILMDVQMPIMDGREATKRIRKLNGEKSGIPIIALTAQAFLEEKKENLASGMNDQISKPIDRNELIKVINRYTNYKVKEDIEVESKKGMSHDIIDYDSAMERLGNNTDLYIELLESFSMQFKQFEAEVFKFLKEEDFKNLRILVHTLKGSSGNLGMRKLFLVAGEFEEMIINKDISKDLIKNCVSVLDETYGEINKYLDSKKKVENTNIDIEGFEKERCYEKLIKELEEFDVNAVNTARMIEEAEKNEKTKKVLEHTKNLEYDKAALLLKELIETGEKNNDE